MLDAEMAAKISERGGVGLSQILLHQLGTRASQAGQEKGDEEH
jgi:Rod binding domain-containing protein